MFLFSCLIHDRHGKKEIKRNTSIRQEAGETPEEFRKFGRKVKGVIVDENGQNVLYIKENLDDQRLKTIFSKIVRNPSYDEAEKEEEKRVDVIGDGYKKLKHCDVYIDQNWNSIDHEKKKDKIELSSQYSEEVRQIPNPPLTTMEVLTCSPPLPPPRPTITENTTASLPRARPPPPPPPPPPPSLALQPQAPSLKGNKSSMLLPPSSKEAGVVSLLRSPPAPKVKISYMTSKEDRSKGTNFGHCKLKPLHWDKIVANADHSMVWDQIHDSSLMFDDGQIETLFGDTTAGRRNLLSSRDSTSSSKANPSPKAQILILEPRKSQNTAIVLKSMAVSRKDIIDALLDGSGLPTDILEKLVRISPTQEEETKLLEFSGNQAKLADAESFLYHILKAVPSAFIRANAMFFRSNYDLEILHVKESLQTLELGCKELRSCKLFLKLLEAILKAGNRMNAGTSRGNAQGFDLRALRKLSDIKSNDGNTTLLHFVVEQVIISEGRRSTHNLDQNQITIDTPLGMKDRTPEETNTEYLLGGLQVMKGLSIEFSNVKKAATIQYDSFINVCSSLTSRVGEIRLLLARIGNNEGSEFVKEMKGFSEECEEELKVVKEEQTRVMEVVNRTTKYYQAGSSVDKGTFPLQLFVIVKEFLDMVDQVCTDVSLKLQNKNVNNISAGSSLPSTPLRQPKLLRPPDFQLAVASDISRISSESDDDF